MNHDEAFSILKNIIFEVNGTPESEINLDDSLITTLAMDSVELIEFLILLEGHGVKINESQLTSNLTVGQVLQIIQK